MRFMRGHHSHREMSIERFTVHTFTCPSFQLFLRSPDMLISALCFWSSELVQSVFYATNWIIDFPRSLFLDLNDIPGNFSNCHDLICTSSFACRDVDGGSRGTMAFQKGDTLRSTFIQARWNSCCSLVSFFFLYLLPLLSETLSTNLSSSRST